MNIHIDLAVLLAVILFFLLRPSAEPRSTANVRMTAVVALVLGLLLVGTDTGSMLLGAVKSTMGMLN